MLRTLVGCLVAAALVGAVSALVGQFGPLAGQVLSTVAMVAVTAVLVWYDAEVSARRSDGFGLASLVVSAVLVVGGLVEIWWPRGPVDARTHGLGGWLLMVLTARVALLHVHLLLNVYGRFPTRGMRALARGTFTLVGVLAGMLVLPIVVDGALPEGYWRAMAAVAILDGAGTVLIPLVRALFHRDRASDRATVPAGGTGQAVRPSAVPGPPGTWDHWDHYAADHRQPPGVRPGEQSPTGVLGGPPRAPSVRLAWPRYEDGRPVPARPDGSPDLGGGAAG